MVSETALLQAGAMDTNAAEAGATEVYENETQTQGSGERKVKSSDLQLLPRVVRYCVSTSREGCKTAIAM